MQSLKEFLEESLRKNLAQARRMQPWNIGIEHEFFLLSQDGLPATLEDSQKFLRALSEQESFSVFEEKDGKILKVSKETPGKGYSQIKYDHEPHLMEISSCFFDNLDSLNQELKEIFLAIESAAKQSNVTILKGDTLDISANHERVSSQDPFFQRLRQFRKDVLSFSKKESNPELENYASVIAATQTHISGNDLNWITKPHLVERLYKYEPFIQGWANLDTNPSGRWNGYKRVYENFPLIGYPKLDTWTVESWLNALEKSPVFVPNQTGALATLSTMSGTESKHNETIADLWHSIRDLQIIRPKVYGSLEFRADPAQSSLERILAIAALRLGISIYVATHDNDPKFISSQSFNGARKLWWENAAKSQVPTNTKILELAHETLIKHRPKDAIFLEPLIEKNNRQAG